MKEFAVQHNHTDKPLIFKFQNTDLTVFKPLECLNYNLYFLCSHVVTVAQHTSNLEMVIEYAYKDAQPVKLTSLANFGRPWESGTKKGFKRIRNRKHVSTLHPSKALAGIVSYHGTNSAAVFLK